MLFVLKIILHLFDFITFELFKKKYQETKGEDLIVQQYHIYFNALIVVYDLVWTVEKKRSVNCICTT